MQTALHSRRDVLAGAASVLAAAALPRFARARSSGDSNLAVVLLLMRGGADALALCVPYADPGYAALRPEIGVPPPGARGGCVPLERGFGLAPAMGALVEPFEHGRLSVVVAAGMPGASREHSAAQVQSELGSPGAESGGAAWLAEHVGPAGRALAFMRRPPVALQGLPAERVACAVDGAGDLKSQLVRAADAVNSDESLRGVVVEHGGYNAHRECDPSSGALGATLTELAGALRAFHDRALVRGSSRPVVLIALSEFGRTVGQNAGRGTDHGDAGAVFVMGRGLPNAGVQGRWPGLAGRHWSSGVPVTTHVGDVIRAALGAERTRPSRV